MSRGRWQSGGGPRSAWYVGNNLIVLNVDAGYSQDTMPHIWGLSEVIHEARHIEWGLNAWSKIGEMDGWQVGIDVAEHLGYYEKGWNARDLAVKNAQTVEDFANAVYEHDKPYWNVLTIWLPPAMTDELCVGLCTLPDWPIGTMN